MIILYIHMHLIVGQINRIVCRIVQLESQMGASGICWFVLPLGELRPKEAAQFQCLLLFLTPSVMEGLLQQEGEEKKTLVALMFAPRGPTNPIYKIQWLPRQSQSGLLVPQEESCFSFMLELSSWEESIPAHNSSLCSSGNVLSSRNWKRVQGCWERDRDL